MLVHSYGQLLKHLHPQTSQRKKRAREREADARAVRKRYVHWGKARRLVFRFVVHQPLPMAHLVVAAIECGWPCQSRSRLADSGVGGESTLDAVDPDVADESDLRRE